MFYYIGVHTIFTNIVITYVFILLLSFSNTKGRIIPEVNM